MVSNKTNKQTSIKMSRNVANQLEYQKLLPNYKKTDSTYIEMQTSNVIYRRRKSAKWFKKRKMYIFAFTLICIFFLAYQFVTYIRFIWDAMDDAKSAYYERNDKKYSREDMEYLKKHVSIYMPGVPASDAHVYIKLGETFTCVDSKEVIKFSQINDNFCDCEDGSDEPSTNACLDNIFSCNKLTFDGKPTIFSSRVNDGICDCCDGSDEWQSSNISAVYNVERNMLIKNNSKSYRTPCTDRCPLSI